MTYVIAYISAAVIFLGLDAVWLGLVAKNHYQSWIGHLMADQPNFFVAAVFYIVYLAGVVYFAIAPALQNGGWAQAAIAGAILGFIAYGTYDFTNLATLKGWPVSMVVADLIWGTFLTSAAATAGYFAAQRLS